MKPLCKQMYCKITGASTEDSGGISKSWLYDGS